MTSPTPPRLLIPGGFSLTLNLTDNGQPAAVVLGGQAGGAWGSQAEVEAWRDAFWTPFKALMLGTVTCTGAVMRFHGVTEGQVVEVGPPAANVGTDTGTSTVRAASTLVRWTTATGGRTGKGRTFLPGLSASNLNADGRTYGSAYGARVTTAVNSYLSAALTVDPAILSFTRGAARPITGGALASVVGIQRRRMRA